MRPNLTQLLKQQSAPEDVTWQPVFYRLSNDEDAVALEQLLSNRPDIQVRDEILLQLSDLIKIENPGTPLSQTEIKELIAIKLSDKPISEFGVWVYFPWKRELIHLLDEIDYFKVRTVRNKYKTTENELQILKNKIIGIVGLSVGHSAALAVAIERNAGIIRIADFDNLELSNLNRINTGLANLGISKTNITARQICEIDPYIKVEKFDAGINFDNLEDFLLGSSKLDILIEECDSIEIKFLIRERCKKYGIPVIMDTSDRGLVDIERYDLDRDYPIFHGLVDKEVSYSFLRTLKNSEEKIPYLLPILDTNNLSSRFRASLLEVGQTITTWPQLGSDVGIGGNLCSIIAKKILLLQDCPSGRFYFDVDKILNGRDTEKTYSIDEGNLSDDKALSIITKIEKLRSTLVLDQSEIIKIVEEVNLTSSPGNTQKWKWYFYNNLLYLFLDKSDETGFADNKSFGSLIACGFAIDQLKISCAIRGFKIESRLYDYPESFQLVGQFAFIKENLENSEYRRLYQELKYRRTDRTTPEYNPITKDHINYILGNRIHNISQVSVIDKLSDIELLGDLIRQGDKLRLLNLYGHAEFFNNELRWDDKSYDLHRDGLCVSHLGLSPKQLAGLKIANNSSAISLVGEIGGGEAFEEFSKFAVRSAGAFVIVGVDMDNRESLIQVGGELNRIWLRATELGIGFHPMTVLQMLFSYLNQNSNSYISARNLNEIQKIRSTYDSLLPEQKGKFSAFCFRLFYSKRELNNTIRKKITDKLIFL